MSRPRLSVFVLGAAFGASVTGLILSPELRRFLATHLPIQPPSLRLRMSIRPKSGKPRRRPRRLK
jgi:hypothetical protein